MTPKTKALTMYKYCLQCPRGFVFIVARRIRHTLKNSEREEPRHGKRYTPGQVL